MSEKPSFLPFEIPRLNSRNMRIGRKNLLRRSYSVVPDDFVRIRENEILHLEVEFRQGEPAAMVVLHTDMDCLPGEWQDWEFKHEKGNVHVLSYKVGCCGSFKFKVKYSFDAGVTWYWDRVPFTHVIVDPAGVSDIRMYTLIPRISGKIGDWSELLPPIARLGFNAVHLLPITTQDLSASPYAARDLFTIERDYLRPEDLTGFGDFELFIVKARELGIRLCFDLVLNHIGVGSNMAQGCPEWIEPDTTEPDGLKRAGCWHMNNWLKWEDLVKIFYDHPHPGIRRDIWEYMKKYALFWSHFAHLTGGIIRLDNLHSSHEGFVTHLLAELRHTYPDLIIMAEYFTDFNTILRKSAEGQINLFSANQWEYPYASNLRNYLRYIHKIRGQVQYYLAVTTHDTGAPAQLFGKAEAAVPRYAVTALMGTGQSGIVQGVEYGVPEKIEFIGRGEKRIFPERTLIAEGIRAINQVLAEAAVFHRQGNLEFIDGDHGAVLGAYRRPAGDIERGYLIFANLDVHNGYHLSVDLSAFLENREKVTLDDRISGARQEFPVRDVTIDLDPCGVKMFQLEV